MYQEHTYTWKKNSHKIIHILGSIVNAARGNLYDHLVSTRLFTLVMIFIRTPKVMRKVGMSSLAQYSLTNHMFHIIGEVGRSGGKK